MFPVELGINGRVVLAVKLGMERDMIVCDRNELRQQQQQHHHVMGGLHLEPPQMIICGEGSIRDQM
jgi:hypothetical protein